MVRPRRTASELLAESVAAFVDTVAALGLPSVSASASDGSTVTIASQTMSTEATIHALAYASPAIVHDRISTASNEGVHVLVADHIPLASRQHLTNAGWGWLDRADHLRLHTDFLVVDSAVPSILGQHGRSSRRAFSGATSLHVAFAALVAGDGAIPGVRALARMVDMSAGGISTAVTSLVESGLLLSDRRGAHPDLFWATVPHWQPSWVAVANVPDQDDLAGAIEVGTSAALFHGAPVMAKDNEPRRFLFRTGHDVRLLSRRLNTAEPQFAAAFLAESPSPIVALSATDGIAAPAIAALQLASEGSRGVEAVEAWGCPARVW